MLRKPPVPSAEELNVLAKAGAATESDITARSTCHRNNSSGRGVSRKMLTVKLDDGGVPIKGKDGMFVMEEVSVNVPVYRPRRSRWYRALWTLTIIGLTALTLFIFNWATINTIGFDLFRFIFGFLPIWG